MDKDKKLFPLVRSTSVIPPDFRAFEINIHPERCQFLKKTGCANIIAVDSPAGWEIQRTGRGEPLHLNIFYIMTGKIEISIPNETRTLTPGKCIIIPSWIPRILSISEPCYHIYIRLNHPEFFPHIRNCMVMDSLNGDAVAFYVKQLLINRTALSDEISYRTALLECLGILLSRELQQTQIAVSRQSGEFMEFLQNAAGSELTVDCVAKKFGMSLSGLRLFCQQQFCKSPSVLIQEIKMQRARAFLIYGDISISRIAAELGYADRFTFSKAFLRLNGITPGKYRERKTKKTAGH